MITEQFDRRTMAMMEAALEKACERLPNGGTHKLRKRAAQNILRCARAGNRRLDALVEAAEGANEQLPESQHGTTVRSGWPDAA